MSKKDIIQSFIPATEWMSFEHQIKKLKKHILDKSVLSGKCLESFYG